MRKNSLFVKYLDVKIDSNLKWDQKFIKKVKIYSLQI